LRLARFKTRAVLRFSARLHPRCLRQMSLQRVAPEALLPPPTTPIEIAKRAAARAAVDAYVRSGMDVGVGSGSTIVYAIQRLAELVHGEAAFKLRCVPTSFQSRQVRNRACFIARPAPPRRLRLPPRQTTPPFIVVQLCGAGGHRLVARMPPLGRDH
jgi:hypothetical protein